MNITRGPTWAKNMCSFFGTFVLFWEKFFFSIWFRVLKTTYKMILTQMPLAQSLLPLKKE